PPCVICSVYVGSVSYWLGLDSVLVDRQHFVAAALVHQAPERKAACQCNAATVGVERPLGIELQIALPIESRTLVADVKVQLALFALEHDLHHLLRVLRSSEPRLDFLHPRPDLIQFRLPLV